MHLRQIFLMIALIASVMGSLTGCLAVAAGGTAGYLVASHKNTVGSYTSDSMITSKIKTKYLANSQVNSLNLSVNTTKGIVSLSGTVSTPAMKNLAVSIARNTSGVRGVNAGSLRVQQS